MNTKRAKEIAKIDRQLDKFETEFATIQKRANELASQYKRLSTEYTKLMERTEEINQRNKLVAGNR